MVGIFEELAIDGIESGTAPSGIFQQYIGPFFLDPSSRRRERLDSEARPEALQVSSDGPFLVPLGEAFRFPFGTLAEYRRIC